MDNNFSYCKTFIKVVKGLDNFLFKLVILRVVKDHSGNVWRRKSTDMYVVEITTDKSFEALTVEDPSSNQNYNQVGSYLYHMLIRQYIWRFHVDRKE